MAEAPNHELSSTSDSSGGGAPVHSASPSNAPDTKETEVNTDDENALAMASSAFGNPLEDPFLKTPGVPRSVAPYSFNANASTNGNGNLFAGYMQRPSTAFPRSSTAQFNNGNQAVTRYRESGSFSSNNSFGSAHVSNTIASGLPSHLQGRGGSALNGFRPPASGPVDRFQPQVEEIQRGVMTAAQYISISAGIAPSIVKRNSSMLQVVAQQLSILVSGLRADRDQAVSQREDEFRGQLLEAAEARRARDVANETLAQTRGREQLLAEHIDTLKSQLEVANRQIKTVREEASRFHDHHKKITDGYKKADETHFYEIDNLENKLKNAMEENKRLSNAMSLVKIDSTDEPTSQTGPHSDATDVKGKGKVVSTLNEKDAAMLLEGLKESVKNVDKEDDNGEGGAFVPNPKAPAWTPHTGTASSRAPNSLAGSGQLVLASNVGSSGRPRTVGPPPRRGTDASQLTGPSSTQSSGAQQMASAMKWGPGGGFPPQQQPAKMTTTTAMPRHKETWEPDDVQVAIDHLLQMVKGYVAQNHMADPAGQRHAPNFAHVERAEPNTYGYLLNMAYPDREQAASHLRYLFDNDAYVPFVIQRMVTDYVFKRVVAPGVFLGFSEEKDGHMSAMQDIIANLHDTTRSVSRPRQRVIEEHALLIESVTKDAGFAAFRAAQTTRITALLTCLLEPLRSACVDRERALRSTRVLVAAALDVAARVWTSAVTLHSVFPECGAKFAVGTMTPLNASQFGARSASELQYSQVRICLTVTPTLTLRDEREGSRLRCYGVHRAEVH
ncbi:hypothetical protein GGR56DRAFT_679943 [Xylariaceae sp. FL0804]|nr:hypothetical protein GGR56DRAFT_679943 [Xylariaceae sp. FL0804]